MHMILAEDSWSHPWEGFLVASRDCAQEELDWQPPPYRDEIPEAGWPPPGSIAWTLNHVAACKQAYAWDLAHPAATDNPCAWTVQRPRAALFEALGRVHAEFIAACRATDPAVAIAGKGGHSLAAYLGIALRHEIWHAGQIALVRRMYARRA